MKYCKLFCIKMLFNVMIAVFMSAPLLSLVHAQEQSEPRGFAGLGQSSPEFARVNPDTRIVFPRDHQAHNDFRIEWWYVTANMTDDQGNTFGLQWTLFRQAIAPPDTISHSIPDRASESTPSGINQMAGKSSMAWINPMVWMGHAGLTTARSHYSAEKFARGGIGQAGVAARPFQAWIDDWSLENNQDDSLQTLTVTAAGEDFSYNVTLSADQSPILQGVDGYSVKSEQGQASHYYSQPFYTLTGTVIIEGVQTSVTGTAWLDREWSSQPLSETQQGWDWFSLHLESGDKVMVFRLRNREGGYFYSGNWITADGQTTPLPRDGIVLTPVKRSSVAGRKIPTYWELSIPSKELSIRTTPLNPKSYMETVFSYWEGPISFQGTHRGVGYLEMTGY